MAKTEREFQTAFNKWCKHVFYKTAAFELKVTPTSSIPFDAVAPHQSSALYAAKHSNVVHKIPDAGFQNPFDSFMLVMVPAYVVVMFNNKDRGQRDFYMIDIDNWLEEERISDRKSLTKERADIIGMKYTLSL